MVEHFTVYQLIAPDLGTEQWNRSRIIASSQEQRLLITASFWWSRREKCILQQLFVALQQRIRSTLVRIILPTQHALHQRLFSGFAAEVLDASFSGKASVELT